MQAYLVGGAVRDHLLQLPVIERDWVVIGETPDSMLARGFRTVGKDFPVFLHPQTHEEYALARTERKTTHGYKGFAVYASPDVTLEQDLLRRDLTVNAMAMTADGTIIDPFNGQIDLERRILRHVSPAFCEDPVRILRISRFVARYHAFNFSIAPETMSLMQNMVNSGEVDYLVPERVWTELVKALNEPHPRDFFESLQKCGALAVIFPELHALFGVPQPAQYHPEIDTGLHSLMALDQATLLTPCPKIRFAALVHDLGKALSPKDLLPRHHGHEVKGLELLDRMRHRLHIPNAFYQLARQVMQYHTHVHKVFELKAATLVDMLAALGAFKPHYALNDFLLACEADARGRTGFEQSAYPQAEYLAHIAQVANQIDTSVLLNGNLQGPKIGEAIRLLRINAVNDVINSHKAL